MQIYPSILESDIDSFVATFNKLSPVFDHFQIDIADGQFVPNRTVQIEDIVNSVASGTLHVAREKTLEFHLMVKDYQAELEKLTTFARSYRSGTISSVLIHLGVLPLSYELQVTRFALNLVLNPEDEIFTNLETIMKFKTVQIMTVHPGAQGSPFVPDALEKINQLREAGYKGRIVLDGGINDQTLPQILKNANLPAGRHGLPDAIAPGSYFTKATDPAQNLAKLRQILALQNIP